MTRKDIRIQYKNEKHCLPDGSMISLNGDRLKCNLDTELSAYINWLEDQLIRKEIKKENLHDKLLRIRAEQRSKLKTR